MTNRSHRVIVIMGLPGTGKSSLAMQLAELTGGRLVRSDMLREELGIRGQYGLATRSRVYREMEARTMGALAQGDWVIVDATFSEPQWQEEFQQVLTTQGIHPFWVLCEASGATLKQRLCSRRPLSDANLEVHEALSKNFGTVVPCLRIQTDQLPIVGQAERVLTELGVTSSFVNSG